MAALAKYEGKDLGAPVAFTYPTGWEMETETGKIETYQAIRLVGPANAEKSFRTTILLQATPLDGRPGEPVSAKDAVNSSAVRFSKGIFDGTQLESQKERTFAHTTAQDMTIRYTVPPIRLQGLKGVAIPVRSRAVVFEREGVLYNLQFTAGAEVFDELSAAFEQVLGSLAFQ